MNESNARLLADNGTLALRNRDLDGKWREASAAIRALKTSYEPRVLEVRAGAAVTVDVLVCVLCRADASNVLVLLRRFARACTVCSQAEQAGLKSKWAVDSVKGSIGLLVTMYNALATDLESAHSELTREREAGYHPSCTQVRLYFVR